VRVRVSIACTGIIVVSPRSIQMNTNGAIIKSGRAAVYIVRPREYKMNAVHRREVERDKETFFFPRRIVRANRRKRPSTIIYYYYHCYIFLSFGLHKHFFNNNTLWIEHDFDIRRIINMFNNFSLYAVRPLDNGYLTGIVFSKSSVRTNRGVYTSNTSIETIIIICLRMFDDMI